MGSLKTLEPLEAADRMEWLMHHAGPELVAAESRALCARSSFAYDAKMIEKLQELARTAREVAKFLQSLNDHVDREIGDE